MLDAGALACPKAGCAALEAGAAPVDAAPNWKAAPAGAAEEAAGFPNWKAAPAGAVEEDAAGLPNWKASPVGAAEEAAGLPNWKASPTGAADEEAAGLPNWKAAPAGAAEEEAAGLPNWKAAPAGAAEDAAGAAGDCPNLNAGVPDAGALACGNAAGAAGLGEFSTPIVTEPLCTVPSSATVGNLGAAAGDEAAAAGEAAAGAPNWNPVDAGVPDDDSVLPVVAAAPNLKVAPEDEEGVVVGAAAAPNLNSVDAGLEVSSAAGLEPLRVEVEVPLRPVAEGLPLAAAGGFPLPAVLLPKENAGGAESVAAFVLAAAGLPPFEALPNENTAAEPLEEAVALDASLAAALGALAASDFSFEEALAADFRGCAFPKENVGALVSAALAGLGAFCAASPPNVNLAELACSPAPGDFFAMGAGSWIGVAELKENEAAGLAAFSDDFADLGVGVFFFVGSWPLGSFVAGRDLEAGGANSNVGKSDASSRRGFFERGPVRFGSENVNTSSLREAPDDAVAFGFGEENALGTEKLASDFVGDVDQPLDGLGLLAAGETAAGAAPRFFADTSGDGDGFAPLPAGREDATLLGFLGSATFGEGSTVDLCGFLSTELREKTGGPSSRRGRAVELAGVAEAVPFEAGPADRGATSRLPRRMPPALKRADRPVDLVADDTANDLARFVAGGDVILSNVSKIRRLVAWDSAAPVDSTALSASDERYVLRFRGRDVSSASVCRFLVLPPFADTAFVDTAEPGRPTWNH